MRLMKVYGAVSVDSLPAGSESTETAPYTFINRIEDFEDALDGNRGLKQHITNRIEEAEAALN